MNSILFPIYGPIAIQWYGVCIAVALLFFLYALKKDPQLPNYLSNEQLTNAIIVGILAAIIGGRSFFIFSNYHHFNSIFDYFALWNGGFTVLGSLIGILCTIPLFFKYQEIPIVRALDRIAIYAPLLQGFARLGCFFGGCCYGLPTTVFWASNVNNVLVHPTPLYSFCNLLLIFIFLFYVGQYYFNKQGQLLSVYLALVCFERFFIDFWRSERDFMSFSGYLSVNQWIAIILITIASYCFIQFSLTSKRA